MIRTADVAEYAPNARPKKAKHEACPIKEGKKSPEENRIVCASITKLVNKNILDLNMSTTLPMTIFPIVFVRPISPRR